MPPISSRLTLRLPASRYTFPIKGLARYYLIETSTELKGFSIGITPKSRSD